MITLALALAAVLAQPADGGPGTETTPTGSEADERLWRDLRGATAGATIGMGRIVQCGFRIRHGKYYERLDATLEDGTDAEKADARALRERLAAEATAAQAAVPDEPGVRACQYVLRDLELFMPIASDPRGTKQVAVLRNEASACVAKLAPLAERLRERASALEAALAAVDARPPRPAASDDARARPQSSPASAEAPPPERAEGATP